MYTTRMPRSYSVADARAHLPAILDQVEAGGEVRLTRRGEPVAVVLSARQYEALRGGIATFADAYKEFRGRHSIEDMGVDTGFFESLRDPSPGRKVRL
jgi:prevent-host-death family protein